jgi:membrane associated rhomboid family serine protease
MLIPLRHEHMQGRRWPVITVGLIALNVIAFLGTHWRIQEQGAEGTEVKIHVLLLAAAHPGLHMTDEVQSFVSSIASQYPSDWKKLQSPDRPVRDAWDRQMRMGEAPGKWQAEMDSLCLRFEEFQSTSILARYAFLPKHPKPVTYITANFLHTGWLHLIGNMWFLWLAGFILEDTWGRPLYSILYLASGVAALQFYGWTNPGSLVPTLGASGAVAALMGAFLVRFPTVKIEMAWTLWLTRWYRFKASAYWLLPIWLFMEVFYGALFGQTSGVAHWAHVGGFLFGAGAALAIRGTGLEHAAEQAIQEKISWVSHPLLAKANEHLEKGELDEAEGDLKKLLQEQPESGDAYRMLQQIHWRRNNVPAHRAALEKLLAIQLKGKDVQEALQTYKDYKTAGGEKLPAATWLELCRLLEEDQQRLDVAVDEYAALAASYRTEKQALLANMAAGRLCLKRLNRSSDALHFYQEAKASPVPHLDWDATIERGIGEATKARQASVLPVVPGD